ncbi:hypothetical protein [Salinisphaera orenii]|uniref:hypothetical protein n=1 Tax=Salinisphaera orenii TaxID=856731 RepID=UPI001C82E128|nr:hypothetical protein [Salinisphaera halophila]
MNKFNQLAATLVSAIAICIPVSATADAVRVDQSDFLPAAGLITFSEFGLNTVNPSYTSSDYGGDANSPMVTFGGFFSGQQISNAPATDCPGGAATGCVVGSPTGPLALDPTSPDTFVTNDGAAPDSPVLSGSPRFSGPIGILFNDPLVGVGLDGGFFDAIGSTKIEAFSLDGNSLGSVANLNTGYNFLGLATEDGTPQIGGLLFSLVADEPAGFGIDNLRFARAGEVVTPSNPVNDVPESSSLAFFLIGALGAISTAFLRRRYV